MFGSRPFRFGVVVAQAGTSEQWIAKARRAEALGYSTFLTPDYVGPGLSPLPALAFAAAATRTIRVGTFVLANDFHSPVFVARESATVDLLSDGRFELGLGAGRSAEEAEYRKVGLPSDPSGSRLDRLIEAVSIIKALLGGEIVSGSGPHYNVVGAEIYPRPVQRPRPPILLAGMGERLLGLAAREADIVGLGVNPRDGEAVLREKIDVVRRAAGSRFETLELSTNLIAVADHGPSAAVVQARLSHLFRLELDDLVRDRSPFVVWGTVDDMVDQLRDRRERFGISYITVPEDLMEAFAPVVERLVDQ